MKIPGRFPALFSVLPQIKATIFHPTSSLFFCLAKRFSKMANPSKRRRRLQSVNKFGSDRAFFLLPIPAISKSKASARFFGIPGRHHASHPVVPPQDISRLIQHCGNLMLAKRNRPRHGRKHIAADIQSEQFPELRRNLAVKIPVNHAGRKQGRRCAHQTMRLNSSQGSPKSQRSKSITTSLPFSIIILPHMVISMLKALRSVFQ